jgi:hypothetical protein
MEGGLWCLKNLGRFGKREDCGAKKAWIPNDRFGSIDVDSVGLSFVGLRLVGII